MEGVPEYSRTWMTFCFFCRQQRRNATAPRPRRVPTRPPRTRTHPQERPLGAYANLRAPRPPNRRHNLYFPSPGLKLQTIATPSRTLPQCYARDALWLPARQLAVLAGKVQYMYLAILAARFYLRELHDVRATRT
jgi:hypothetical protein